MSIKIRISYNISGKDAETLGSICELARRYMDKNMKCDTPITRIKPDTLFVDEYSYDQICKMQKLMRKIWGT